MDNILGATITLAAGATDVSVPDFTTTQYNPVPWPANLVIMAAVRPSTPADAGQEQANLTLFARGKEFFKNASISSETMSPVYSQLGVADLPDGTPWNLTVSNPSGVSVVVEFNLHFYHDNENGEPAEKPTLFV